jgi:hypothetical protein
MGGPQRVHRKSALERTMELQQLKLLAGRVRQLLQQSNHPVGHNKSLDLIAAVPGLRNWPEVLAFPERVDQCRLDDSSARRLAYRLGKTFDLHLPHDDLLKAICPDRGHAARDVLHVWPGGPNPGVYVTTSPGAINAFIARYVDATDGGVFYAEKAGEFHDNSVDLGDHGLWSSGLSRIPSGTLLVVGPLQLDQQSWEECGRRLDMACLIAQESKLRVAVLFETETPEAVCEDAMLLVYMSQGDYSESETALVGVITDDGQTQLKEPFNHARPFVRSVPTVATPDAIPANSRALMAEALKESTSGLVLVGTDVIQDHWAMDLVAATLSLTEHVGPAARIMPRHRSTPSKDWQVPDAIRQLPYLPSIESAYEQHYRRLIFDPTFTKASTIIEYCNGAMLIGGVYGTDVADVFRGGRAAVPSDQSELLAHVVAILGVMRVQSKRGEVLVSDFLDLRGAKRPATPLSFKETQDFLEERRTLKWEDQVNLLLDSGQLTLASLKRSHSQNRVVSAFLSNRVKKKQK